MSDEKIEIDLEERRELALQKYTEETELHKLPENLRVLQERAFLYGYSHGHNDLIVALDEEVEEK